MDYKVAVACGHDYKDHTDRVVVDCKQKRAKFKATNVVTVAHILQDLNDGLTSDEIINKRGIRQRAMDRAVSWIAAILPEQYATFSQFPTPMRKLRILLDEGVSYHSIAQLAPQFGYVSHIYFEGLGGKPDSDVLEYAAQNNFDAVFSMDRNEVAIERNRASGKPATARPRIDLADVPDHLTQLARFKFEARVMTGAPSYPMVVHMPNGMNANFDKSHPVIRQAGIIAGHIKQGEVPFITLKGDSIFTGPNMQQIWDKEHAMMAGDQMTRAESYAVTWAKRVGHRLGLSSSDIALLEVEMMDLVAVVMAMREGRYTAPLSAANDGNDIMSGFPGYTAAERTVFSRVGIVLGGRNQQRRMVPVG